jgi:S1-C subfamily serine protease
MRPFLCTTLCLLATVNPATAQNSSSTKNLAEMIQQVRNCIVRIEVDFPNDTSTGTGFFVNTDGMVVTAMHVIYPLGKAHPPDRIRAEVRIPTYQNEGLTILTGWRDYTSDVLATDDAHDIALLKPAHEQPFPEIGMIQTPTRRITVKPLVAKLDPHRLRDGEPVFTSGYPLDLAILITTSGFIASSDPMTYDHATRSVADIYWADLHVNPGNSGGPLFSLESGDVIGMVVALRAAPVSFGDGTPNQANGIAQVTNPLTVHPLVSNSGLSIVLSSRHIVEFLKSVKPPIRYEIDERK